MKRGYPFVGRALLILFLFTIFIALHFWQEPLLTTFRTLQDNVSAGEEIRLLPDVPFTTGYGSNEPRIDIVKNSKGGSIDGQARREPFSCDHRTGDLELFDKSTASVESIMSHGHSTSGLQCPSVQEERYSALQHVKNSDPLPKYFFALDLHQSIHIIDQLLGSVVDAIRYLGPSNCFLSILEGRSTDGTYEILEKLKTQLPGLGLDYQLQCNEDDPFGEGRDRIVTLASLRNYALLNLTSNPDSFDPDTAIVFLNDVALCTEDILELIYQRQSLKADMTCAMDWINGGGLFYDVWISRMINGETFFEVPQSGSWDFSSNLFWNDRKTKDRYNLGYPFQVFSCWNGAVVMTAKPFREHKIRFRSEYEGECRLGEPVHLCKDLWKLGHGRIAVVPSVNVAYQMEDASLAKDKHGTVSSWVARQDAVENKIVWKAKPPQLVKCVTPWNQPSWEDWDQGLPRGVHVG